MKLKQLESLLQDVEPFREPDQMLEQYPTGAHLASRVVAEAHAHGDIEGRAVVDLGVGGGVLTIASLLMGAAKVTGLDLDPNALDLTRENCAAFDPPLEPALALARIPRDVARLRRRVTREEIRSVDARDARERHDTTLCRRSEDERTDTDEDSNRDSPTSSRAPRGHGHHEPPFGTRRRGADLGFLRAGLMLARNAVYSLNKTSTRAHVERHATRALRASSATVLAELRYELPKTYAHHRRESVEIEVDLWRFEPPRDGRVGRGKRESENPSDERRRFRDGVGESGVGIGFGFGRRRALRRSRKRGKIPRAQVRGRARRFLRPARLRAEARGAERREGRARLARGDRGGKRKRRKGSRRGKVRRRRSGPGEEVIDERAYAFRRKPFFPFFIRRTKKRNAKPRNARAAQKSVGNIESRASSSRFRPSQNDASILFRLSQSLRPSLP